MKPKKEPVAELGHCIFPKLRLGLTLLAPKG